MNKSRFLMFFAFIEILTAVIFISLAVIFFISKDFLGGDLTIPIIFAFIGCCSMIAVPVLFKLAKKHNQESLFEPVNEINK
jgi:hypothetical protein